MSLDWAQASCFLPCLHGEAYLCTQAHQLCCLGKLLIGNRIGKQGHASKLCRADLPDQCGSGKDPGRHIVRLDEQAALWIPQEVCCVHCLFPQAQDWLPLTVQDIAGICPQGYLILSNGGEGPVCHEVDDSPCHLCAETWH